MLSRIEVHNRPDKPGAVWTTRDLHAFKIEITAEHDIQTFFGVSELPVPQNISPVIWNNVRAPAGPLSKTEKTFFAYMEDALRTPPGEMSLVDDFALFLLRLFGYDDGPHSVLRSQHDIWFPVCGSRVNAKTDGAVIERVGRQSYYVLLVQEDTVCCVYMSIRLREAEILLCRAVTIPGATRQNRNSLDKLSQRFIRTAGYAT